MCVIQGHSTELSICDLPKPCSQLLSLATLTSSVCVLEWQDEKWKPQQPAVDPEHEPEINLCYYTKILCYIILYYIIISTKRNIYWLIQILMPWDEVWRVLTKPNFCGIDLEWNKLILEAGGMIILAMHWNIW